MPKAVPLPLAAYRLIEGLKKGQEIVLTVHGDVNNKMTCEVVTAGRKPIKCKARRLIPKGRSGGNPRSVEIVFKRA